MTTQRAKKNGFCEERWRDLLREAREFSRTMFVNKSWLLDGDVDTLVEILRNPSTMVNWWPEAFLQADEIFSGDDEKIGHTIRFHTKGWLPHTFQFLVKVLDVDPSGLVCLEVKGDFSGYSIIRFSRSEGKILAEYQWLIQIRQPYIQVLVPFMKFLFAANHAWVMSKGKMGLQRELDRRLGRIPNRKFKPRTATFPHNLNLVRQRMQWSSKISSWDA